MVVHANSDSQRLLITDLITVQRTGDAKRIVIIIIIINADIL
jgi:hypothetical protein